MSSEDKLGQYATIVILGSRREVEATLCGPIPQEEILMKEECHKALLFIFPDKSNLGYAFRLVYGPLKPLALLPFLTLNRLAGIRTLLVLVAPVRGCLSGFAQRTTPFIVARVGLRTYLKEISR